MFRSNQFIPGEVLESRRLLSAAAFEVTNLVSDGAVPAEHTDPHLLNAWGIVVDGKTLRVANNGDSSSRGYNRNGKNVSPLVHIPGGNGQADGAPTGVALNRSDGFVISSNGKSAPARFIFVGEDGAITGYNPKVSANAIVGEDSSDEDAVYKGVALAKVGKDTFLYAADFHNASINVYNDEFEDADLPGKFNDPNLPDGYAPFNIAELQGHLFVAFAKTVPGSDDEMDGPGLGVVDEFKNDGTFLRRIGAGGTLNAPWGMAIAPKHFGRYGGDLLVGNFGDGRINVFSLKGSFIGQLKDDGGEPIEIDDLWGIAFGHGRDKRSLFFAAGTNDEADGLVGVIRAAPGKNQDSSTGDSVAGASAMSNLFSSVKMSAGESDLVSLLTN
jgi:uncharacterized protein (TIGR03118 family)